METLEPIPDVDLRDRRIRENIGACALELDGICDDIITYLSDDHALTDFATKSKADLQLILQTFLTLRGKGKTINSLVDIHNELIRLLQDSGLTYNQKFRFKAGLENSEDLLRILISQYDQVGGSRRQRTRRLRKRRRSRTRRRSQ